MNKDIKIFDNLSINQNIICLIVSYAGIIYVAQFNIDNICLSYIVSFVSCLCTILFFISAISVMSSMVIYAIEYWAKKWYKFKSHQLHLVYRKKIVQEHMNYSDADSLAKIDSIFNK